MGVKLLLLVQTEKEKVKVMTSAAEGGKGKTTAADIRRGEKEEERVVYIVNDNER